jgi:uncharacterized protein YgiM (DUF1202 family)
MASKKNGKNILSEKDETKQMIAEETADKTNQEPSLEMESEPAEGSVEESVEQNDAEPEKVEEVVPEKVAEPSVEDTSVRRAEVVCDQLYLRPEPNKVGTPLDVLQKGTKLELVETDAKLPAGWTEVKYNGTIGYVMTEFIK